jgi:hypothetical protein
MLYMNDLLARPKFQIKYLSAIAKYHVGLVEACGLYHIE